MPQLVCNGATLMCSFGAAPGQLTVLPTSQVTVDHQPAATVADHAPIVNIMPFGLCSAPSNPQVAAATAAAMGVLTPQPCIPATSAPWIPGSTAVRIGGQAALMNTCQLMCNWMGVITVSNPGQQTVMVGR
jgi:hypothetical protein